MLSLFPNLFNYQLLAPFILRVTVGIFLFYWGLAAFRSADSVYLTSFEIFKLKRAEVYAWILSILSAACGILLVLGLFTQAAALLGIILSGFLLAVSEKENRPFYALILIISFSILFLGPGFWAIDLPL